MLIRLLVFALVGLALDAAIWLSDFGSFYPSSRGPFAERMYSTVLTAAGPLAMVIMGNFVNLGTSLLITAGPCALLVALGLKWRQRLVARLAAYCGVTLWFLFGFAFAAGRMT
jgi:hypothetical protein